MNFSEVMKKVLLAGIGAVAATAEKGQAVIDMLVKKGEMTVEQGKILNEELKHKVKSAGAPEPLHQKEAPKPQQAEQDDLLSQLEKLTPEQRARLKEQLDAMDSGK